MSQPFLAEVRIYGFNFAPRGYALCDGQILPINQYQSLYSLLGTTYGGDGRTTFGLPELRGRTPLHVGTGFALGQKGGEETHILLAGETPTHTHTLRASSSAKNSNKAQNNVFARAGIAVYHTPDKPVNMNSGTVSNTGGSQGHENMQPYQAVTFCIALQGLFPSRN